MKLSNDSLNRISAQLPNYDRKNVKIGIVHLGVGAFHRAHQAVYVDDILADDPSWGILGASLKSTKTADALNPQDGLYTMITKGGGEPEFRVIGSINSVICAAQSGSALIEHMAHPDVRIVSLTVTEKGYCHTPATGQLDVDNVDVKHDLANPTQPRTAPGFLVAALSKRQAAGANPFTVLSCDNLPQNGKVAKQVVIDLARMQSPALANWIEKNATFPATMVDRIVPATTSNEKLLVKSKTGAVDAWPVVTEPFCQWVVEDNFCAGRPAFENVGVVLTDNVDLFEKMKLRLLNGSHSALAYLGLLRGHTTVAEAMGDAKIKSFVKTMMEEEVIDTLDIPAGVDLSAYQAALLKRFENPDLNHSLLQIASDGSQKLPQRILAPIRERIEKNQRFTRLAQVVAAWLKIVGTRDAQGFQFTVSDPLAIELHQCVEQSKPSASGLYLDILQRRDIFGDDLANNTVFHDTVEESGRHQ